GPLEDREPRLLGDALRSLADRVIEDRLDAVHLERPRHGAPVHPVPQPRRDLVRRAVAEDGEDEQKGRGDLQRRARAVGVVLLEREARLAALELRRLLDALAHADLEAAGEAEESDRRREPAREPSDEVLCRLAGRRGLSDIREVVLEEARELLLRHRRAAL